MPLRGARPGSPSFLVIREQGLCGHWCRRRCPSMATTLGAKRFRLAWTGMSLAIAPLAGLALARSGSLGAGEGRWTAHRAGIDAGASGRRWEQMLAVGDAAGAREAGKPNARQAYLAALTHAECAGATTTRRWPESAWRRNGLRTVSAGSRSSDQFATGRRLSRRGGAAAGRFPTPAAAAHRATAPRAMPHEDARAREPARASPSATTPRGGS
jgi:hypothetical protein